MRRVHNRGWVGKTLVVMALLAGGVGTVSSTAGAQDRLAGLTGLLLRSSDFRVRIQAAFALARIGDRRARPPLQTALLDPHPAVRAAAAVALSRLGDPAALDALRARLSDPEPIVREQAQLAIRALEQAAPAPAPAPNPLTNARAFVAVGLLDNRSGSGSTELRRRFRDLVIRMLGESEGIAVQPEDDGGEFPREAARRNITGYRLEGNIARITRTHNGTHGAVRCEVSLVVLSEPQRNLLMMLSGAATAELPSGALPADVEEQYISRALEAAVRGAFQRFRQAIAQALP